MAFLKKFLNYILSPFIELNKIGKGIIIIVLIIIIFGLVMLFSASSVVAYNTYNDSYFFLKHQLFGLIIGIFTFWFFLWIDYHKWRKYALLMLIASILLLSLVFIPGLRAEWGRARSWINIFGFSFQPAEFVKITFLIYLAAWLEGRKEKLKEFSQGIGPFIVVLSVIALLMLLQPDIGTLIIIALTSLIVFFIGGGNIKHILIIIFLGILSLSIMVRYKPYQAERFKCLLDPSYAKKESCYQINQSLIAIGSGGFWGRGLGASRQKFMYLPEVEADSIFPIIGEETGFLYSTGLIIIYLVLFYQGYLVAKQAADDFGKLLAIGIVSWLTFQALINIGGMINLLPMTGLPLPFVSYGGTALMASLGAIGILVNISQQTKN